MLKTEQNIAFTGAWANFKINRVLNSAIESRKPQLSGKLHRDLFGRPHGEVGVSLWTPSKEVQITARLANALDSFIKSEPNKKSFKIVEKIKKSFPLVKPNLVRATTGEKIKSVHSALQRTLDNLVKLRQDLHTKLNKFVEEKGIKK
ncbi:MAG: hypothetical protein A2039_10265 [Candidatus Melainabacteria bacterium GWA2_34_9]|nr:MAG: hypothetical protein A2039_10265 [Candidatus Melainabacteria bacterium GWA2_34_9]